MFETFNTKIREIMANHLYIKRAHPMLSLLTLTISDKEVAKDYELHYANKFDRSFWFRAVVFTYSCVQSWQKYFRGQGPAFALIQDTIILVVNILFEIYRKAFKDSTRYHSYFALTMFIVPVIICSIVNAGCMPERLREPNPNDNRQGYLVFFYGFAFNTHFSLVKVVLAFGPIFLVASYFFASVNEQYWKQISF
jgi:hypothetical protein